MSERGRVGLGCVTLVTVVLLVYGDTWGHGFVNYDDDVAIVNLALIRSLTLHDLPRFFAPTIYRGLPEYMPLKNLSYAVDYALFGLDATGFRVQQQLWYLASVLLFFLWCRSLLVSGAGRLRGLSGEGTITWAAWAAALLFALHPAHVESVTWLSGRKDVLSGAFMLAALLAARRDGRYLLLSLSLSLLALLSKPTAVVLPGLFLVQDLAMRRDVSRSRIGFHAVASLMCGGFALFYVGFTQSHAAAAGAELSTRVFEGPAWLRWGQQYAAFLGLSLVPVGLSPLLPTALLDPEVASPGALSGLLLLAGVLGGCVLAALRRSVWLLPLGLFCVSLVPIVLSPPWGQYVAARYLFHAVGGVALGLVLGAVVLRSHAPRLSPLLGGALLAVSALWGALTVQYNASWRSSSALWESALVQFPSFTALHRLAASAHGLEGHPELAIDVLARCLQVAPDDAACQAQLGELLLRPDPARGEALLRKALPRDPSGRAARALAVHLLHTQRSAEALALYERSLNGKAVSAQDLSLLVRLSLANQDAERALRYARDMLAAAAMNAPGSPAPVQTLAMIAEATGDAELKAKLRDAAAAGCASSACLKRALGW